MECHGFGQTPSLLFTYWLETSLQLRALALVSLDAGSNLSEFNLLRKQAITLGKGLSQVNVSSQLHGHGDTQGERKGLWLLIHVVALDLNCIFYTQGEDT